MPVRDNQHATELLNKKRILLVEDDSTFRRLISELLVQAGAVVRACENGLVAKTVFDLQPCAFDLIVSDIRMPELDGVGFLSHVRSHENRVPFLMMTGFSEIMETQRAFELGADHFLSKPFRRFALIEAACECLFPELRIYESDKKEVEPAQFQYCQIPIGDFLSSSSLVSDVHIRLGVDKFVRVACKGDSIPLQRLQTYEEKNVENLYVKREDFGQYVGFSFKIARLANGLKEISREKKINLLANATNLISSQAALSNLDRKSVEDARSTIVDILNVITEDTTILNLLEQMQIRQDRQFDHTLLVVTIGSILAKKKGWHSPTSMFKVVVGALFHDVGNKELKPELLAKPRILLTADEIGLLESHSARGRDILLGIRSLPDEIAMIAYHHHERISGAGYPQRLTAHAIHPVAKLIAVVDHFCDLISAVDIKDSMSIPLALARMTEISEDFDPEHLAHLVNTFSGATRSSVKLVS